jgi:hypothetical protein
VRNQVAGIDTKRCSDRLPVLAHQFAGGDRFRGESISDADPRLHEQRLSAGQYDSRAVRYRLPDDGNIVRRVDDNGEFIHRPNRIHNDVPIAKNSPRLRLTRSHSNVIEHGH